MDFARLLVFNTALAQMLFQQAFFLQAVQDMLKSWTKLSMPSQLMVLRLYCNIFNGQYSKADPAAAYFVQSDERLSLVIDCVANAFTGIDGLRQTASSLAANLSLYLPKSNSDQEAQLISTIAQYLPTEQNDEVMHRMLLCLYRLLQNNTAGGVDLMIALEPNFTNAKSKKNCAKLVEAIQALLK